MSGLDGDETVDTASLETYLAAELGEAETFDVSPIGGGNANETFAVTWGDRELVLRRPPIDEPAPEILHDILREYEVLEALEETWVPTPDVVTSCDDPSVVGDPFYLMERLAGDIIEYVPPDRFENPDDRERIGLRTIDTLAKIHDIDVAHVGLETFGDPTDFAAREVQRMRTQLEWAQERTGEEREVPVLHEVGRRLADDAPTSGDRTLVHGDYKPDNIVFAPGTPARVGGVLDWEMSTIGDPLADLGWILAYWAESRDPSPVTDDLEERVGDHEYFPQLDVYAEQYSKFMREPDYPSRQDLVARYEAQTPFEYEHDRFYRGLAIYKLAALCEGFFRIHLEGSPSAKESHPFMAVMVPMLGQQAKQILDGEVPL